MFRIVVLAFVVAAGFFCTGCNDDDVFSSSVNSRLTFEADTLSFDTVWTGVTSSTRRIRIYNNNKDGVRITSVALGSGGTSGFQMNVDGQSGSVVNDVEMLGNDSLFVFAQVRIAEDGEELPHLVRDSIVFTLESGVQQKLILEAWGQNVNVLRGVTIDSDTHFDSSRPYLVYDSLVVTKGATLFLDAGTTVCFHNGAYLGVHGKIKAKGTLEQPVTLRGDRTDKMLWYLPYDRMDGGWGGVTLYGESFGNEFNNVDIHGGLWGINCRLPESGTDEDVLAKQKLLLLNSVITNVRGNALDPNYVQSLVANCEISNAGGYCVRLSGGKNEFVHTTIAQFYPWSAGHKEALLFTNVVDSVAYPLEQADFKNCLITGRTTDEIVGQTLEGYDVAFNASFRYCLINIKLTGEEGEAVTKMFETCVNETADFHNKSLNLTDEDKEKIIWGKKNFVLVGGDYYYYDFSLDSLSRARGIGLDEYTDDFPIDRRGIQRPSSNADAGCYQYKSEE